jgi:magnesium-dependent phosphatase 1
MASSYSELQPKLIVFDLDYTLWPFWVDTHVDPPFKPDGKGGAFDRQNYHIELYPDVRDLLNDVSSKGILLAVASRTQAPDAAHKLLRAMDMDKYFHYREIYPGSKVAHFESLKKNSGVQYTDMLFFDDEHRNILDINQLGTPPNHTTVHNKQQTMFSQVSPAFMLKVGSIGITLDLL